MPSILIVHSDIFFSKDIFNFVGLFSPSHVVVLNLNTV